MLPRRTPPAGQFNRCGGLYPNAFTRALTLAPESLPLSILAIGQFQDGSNAKTSLEGWVTAAGYATGIINYVTTIAGIRSVDISAHRVLYIPSTNIQTPGGVSKEQVGGGRHAAGGRGWGGRRGRQVCARGAGGRGRAGERSHRPLWVACLWGHKRGLPDRLQPQELLQRPFPSLAAALALQIIEVIARKNDIIRHVNVVGGSLIVLEQVGRGTGWGGAGSQRARRHVHHVP
jgi:hypothetical protein